MACPDPLAIPVHPHPSINGNAPISRTHRLRSFSTDSNREAHSRTPPPSVPASHPSNNYHRYKTLLFQSRLSADAILISFSFLSFGEVFPFRSGWRTQNSPDRDFFESRSHYAKTAVRKKPPHQKLSPPSLLLFRGHEAA